MIHKKSISPQTIKPQKILEMSNFGLNRWISSQINRSHNKCIETQQIIPIDREGGKKALKYLASSQIKIVHQHCIAFGNESMGTYGVGSCVAIAGIDKKNNICFVGHFDACTQVYQSMGALCYMMIKSCDANDLSFNIMMVSGQFDDSSQKIVDCIYNFIKNSMPSKIKMEVIGTMFSKHSVQSLGVDMHSKDYCHVHVVPVPRKQDIEYDCHVMRLMFDMMNGQKTPAYIC